MGHYSKYKASQTCTSLRCTGQCPVPRLARPTNRLLSRKIQCPATIIHWALRCAPDYPVSPCPTVDFANGRLPQAQKQSEGQKQSGHQTVWWSDPTVDCYRPHGRLTWQAPDNEQCHVQCAPDCPVHPSTESYCFMSNDYIVGRAINTPNHLHSAHPCIQYIHIQYKSKEFITRHIQSFQSSLSVTIKTSDQ
jgi:hypothetical protein